MQNRIEGLHNVLAARDDEEALSRFIDAFRELEPLCSFYCSGSPVDGAKGLKDKVRHGRMVGKFVDREVLDTIIGDPKLLAADKFPHYCKTNYAPLVWKCEPTKLEDKYERKFFGLAADFNVTGGVTVPVHQADGATYGNLTLFFDRAIETWIDRLKATIGDVHVATLYLHHKLSQQRFGRRRQSLSPRERDCISFLAIGYQTAQIADRLNLSDATVNEYIANARKKLGAQTRAQAVAVAVQHHLIEL